MTTTPFIDTVDTSCRIALTAAWSAPFFSPRPTQRPAAIAAASVTRTSSSARLRSGRSPPTRSVPGTDASDMPGWYPRGASQDDDGDLRRLDAHPYRRALRQAQLDDC